jgi:hypothetical protein
VSKDRTADRPLTPEESRWLDGELPAEGPDGARALEERLAADPARAARLAALREAGHLWREEARRTARLLIATGAIGTFFVRRDPPASKPELSLELEDLERAQVELVAEFAIERK